MFVDNNLKRTQVALTIFIFKLLLVSSFFRTPLSLKSLIQPIFRYHEVSHCRKVLLHTAYPQK